MGSLVMYNDTDMENENVSKLKNKIQKLENHLKHWMIWLAQPHVWPTSTNSTQRKKLMILNWPEHKNQNLKEGFSYVMSEIAGVNL